MKKKSTQTGSASANSTALLLPLDADGFTSILETIAGETPKDFTSKQSDRRIEAAHRLAWCEVTEATEKIQPSADTANHVKLAEASAQRKLTAILDGLMPAIALRNQTAAAASEQLGLLCHLKENAEPIETEAATLKSRDARDWRGEAPITETMEDEISRLEDYLNDGDWKASRYDRADAEFKAGLRVLIEQGYYTGKPTKDAVVQRIADLTAQVKEVNSKINNMLDSYEMLRLNELESKLLPIRAEITAAEGKASAMVAAAEAAAVELKVKTDAAAIIASAIIHACHIQSGISTAAA